MLGYPELAIGDLYKSVLLYNALADQTGKFSDQVILDQCMRLWVEGAPGLCKPYFLVNEDSAEEWNGIMNSHVRTNQECAYQGLIQGLIEIGCFFDALKMCKEARRKGVKASALETEEGYAHGAWTARLMDPESGVEAPSKLDKPEMTKTGSILLRRYPWMPTKAFQRTPATISKRTAEMEQASNGQCSISPSTIGPADSYGVKALKDIEPGETIMQETTVVVAIGDYSGRCTVCCVVIAAQKGILLKCCKLRVCSAHCAKQATRHFHRSTCERGIPIKWRGPASTNTPTYAARERLMEKVLAILVQGRQGPFDSPLINQLMAPYDDTEVVGFHFGIDIVSKFEFLQNLGVDIFANPQYDTWVLHTIAARIQNNVHHGADVEPNQLLALHPLYSFFNHSCARNASWLAWENEVNRVSVTAIKRIRKGEEIFIQYHGVESLSLEARQIVLRTWFPDGCQCQRCQSERGSRQFLALRKR
jgi:hypothetical protein